MTALSWSALVIGAALTLLLFAFVVRRPIGVRVPAPPGWPPGSPPPCARNSTCG